MNRANASLRNHGVIWAALGNLESDIASRVAAHNELSEDSEKGRSRRAMLANALKELDREEHGLGIEMNQRYTSSAVFKSDQGKMPTFDTDDLVYYHPTTYPGARVPHVWLTHKVPGKHFSTIDIAGKGRFTLFTGIGGEGWKAACEGALRGARHRDSWIFDRIMAAITRTHILIGLNLGMSRIRAVFW